MAEKLSNMQKEKNEYIQCPHLGYYHYNYIIVTITITIILVTITILQWKEPWTLGTMANYRGREEIYNMSLEHFVLLQSKEASK